MTDRELMQEALEALTYVGDKDIYSDTIDALRARLSQPGPVAWWHDRGDVVDLNVSGHGTPLYFAPPQREWVGLTEMEKVEIQMLKWWDWEDTFDLDGYTRAIEAKLKEKNA